MPYRFSEKNQLWFSWVMSALKLWLIFLNNNTLLQWCEDINRAFYIAQKTDPKILNQAEN